MNASARVAPGWRPLLITSLPAVSWPSVLAVPATALLIAGALAVLPPVADAVVPVLCVLVLASGVASAADDDAAAVTGTTPVPVRRRLAARLLLVLPVSAAGLAGVLGIASLAGSAPPRSLAVLWLVLSGAALAIGALARRTADVPGTAAAAVVLMVGLVVATRLPAPVLAVPIWNSSPERVAIALAASLALLASATRDPAD